MMKMSDTGDDRCLRNTTLNDIHYKCLLSSSYGAPPNSGAAGQTDTKCISYRTVCAKYVQ